MGAQESGLKEGTLRFDPRAWGAGRSASVVLDDGEQVMVPPPFRKLLAEGDRVAVALLAGDKGPIALSVDVRQRRAGLVVGVADGNGILRPRAGAATGPVRLPEGTDAPEGAWLAVCISSEHLDELVAGQIMVGPAKPHHPTILLASAVADASGPPEDDEQQATLLAMLASADEDDPGDAPLPDDPYAAQRAEVDAPTLLLSDTLAVSAAVADDTVMLAVHLADATALLDPSGPLPALVDRRAAPVGPTSFLTAAQQRSARFTVGQPQRAVTVSLRIGSDGVEPAGLALTTVAPNAAPSVLREQPDTMALAGLVVAVEEAVRRLTRGAATLRRQGAEAAEAHMLQVSDDGRSLIGKRPETQARAAAVIGAAVERAAADLLPHGPVSLREAAEDDRLAAAAARAGVDLDAVDWTQPPEPVLTVTADPLRQTLTLAADEGDARRVPLADPLGRWACLRNLHTLAAVAAGKQPTPIDAGQAATVCRQERAWRQVGNLLRRTVWGRKANADGPFRGRIVAFEDGAAIVRIDRFAVEGPLGREVSAAADLLADADEARAVGDPVEVGVTVSKHLDRLRCVAATGPGWTGGPSDGPRRSRGQRRASGKRRR